jgi:hypothetical protein
MLHLPDQGHAVTAPVDLAALPPVVVVPGIAAWLGQPTANDEPDEYEALCQQLSQEAA